MTDAVVADREGMIRGMRPRLCPGRFVFATVAKGTAPADAVGSFREAEGLSVIRPAGADAAGPVMRQITLEVRSSLEGVGLTAAVAGALADAGIPCNMVAAHHHDHAFVPEDRAEEALEILSRLSDTGGAEDARNGRDGSWPHRAKT